MADEDEKPEDDGMEDVNAEGESGEEGEEGEDGESKKGGLPKIVFIIAPIILLIAIGAGLYFTGMLDSLLGKEKAEVSEEVVEEEIKKETVFLSVPDMIVNLKSSSKQQRYLKLRVELEINGPEELQAVEKVAPRVIDHFQTYLRELRVRDLEGSQGIYRLRQELLARVNAAAYPVEVQDVLFQEILIQ